jgi:hypothetical protein
MRSADAFFFRDLEVAANRGYEEADGALEVVTKLGDATSRSGPGVRRRASATSKPRGVSVIP